MSFFPSCTPGEVDRWEADYRAGKSTRQIAKAFRVSQWLVRKHLARRLDLRPVGRGRPVSEVEVELARDMLSEGLSVQAIAQVLGRPYSTAHRISQRARKRP